MISAAVSSWSCFCWLYRASPSLAAKNIINLILVLAIWWCPRVESSLVLLEEGVCYDQCVLLANSVSLFPVSFFFFNVKLACYTRDILSSYFCIPVPYIEKDIFFFFFFLVLFKWSLGHHRAVQLQLLQHYWSGYRLGLTWYRIVLLRNEQRSFCCFEIAPNYCILDSCWLWGLIHFV